MLKAQCELCGSPEREYREHGAVQQEMWDQFCWEHSMAMIELDRLKSLLKNVMWYNFEVKVRDWKFPWHQSLPESNMTLHSACFYKCNGWFPLYYKGAVKDAPALPPEILIVEIKQAQELCDRLLEQSTAVWDWAPGGRKYNELLKESVWFKN